MKLWTYIFFATIFVSDFLLNSWGIHFPFYWHPDEEGKIMQIQTGNYNFNHPQLIFHFASFSKLLLGYGDSVREIDIAGRFASGFATAVAVVSFAALLYRRFGPTLAFVGAVAVAITPSVFLNAHYFKEESFLLMGVSIAMLAIQNVAINPGRQSAILAGLALGICCSTKYIGAIMLLPALAVLINRVRWTNIVLCIAIACGTFVVINSHGIFGTASLEAGFSRELAHALTSHFGISWGPLSTRAIRLLFGSMSLFFIALWIAGTADILRNRDRVSINGTISFDLILFFTPILFLIANQFSMIAFPRYFLAITGLMTVCAAWTVGSLGKDNQISRPALLIFILGIAFTTPPFIDVVKVLRDNPKYEVARWIRTNLPTSAKIAQDFFPGLPTPERHALDPTIPTLPQSVTFVTGHMGAMGSIRSLRELGFTHMVISSASYDRLYDPTATLGENALKQKKFYDEVFATLTPVYVSEAVSNADFILSSRILVYDLTVAPATQ